MQWKGTLLVMLAAVFWGLSGVIGDLLMSNGWDPFVISFYRGAIGFICFLIWFILRYDKNYSYTTRLYVWSIIAGIGVTFNFSLYYLGIQLSSITIASTLMYTAPLFVLLVSFLLGIERSTWFKWGCVVSVLMGIILLTGAYNIDEMTVSFAGILAGVFAGISYAVFIFSFKKAAKDGSPQVSLTFAFLAFSLILLLFIDRSEALNVLTSSDVGWFLLLGFLGAGLSFAFFFIGIRWTAPTTASMIAMVEPVTASFIGVIWIGDDLTMVQLIGMTIVLITITTLSVKQA
ncbi:EamA-like transporter family protein [Pelagirhabdus alkalitolerans]|uniref:EamA-like transporter family protein n=1 Tax=Pelagirhabdus alkalitolerans TaxID=1612202 RepID=A0A1G6H8Y1_9BACI|nr:DMT family transporter [Pelagirhabdus alkalitolerans]SDB89876.1 EamA-like transporter family protein [Pelagirhabdus alkalitolerans]